MPSSTSLRRWGARLLVFAFVATMLVTVPAPTLVSATTNRAVVRTDHRRLGLGDGLARVAQLSPAAALEPEVRAAAAPGADRRTTHQSSSFDAVGITAPAPPTGPVLLRARVGGQWTPWTEAEFLPDEAPDRAAEPTTPGAHSQPIWFGDATAYEIDAPAGVAALDVHLVSDEVTGTTRQVQPASAAAAGAPAMLGRSSWGARAPLTAPVVSSDLKAAVVHHSVNSNTYSATQVPAMLRSIQAYHQDVQGWNDIAYNFVVDRFGRVWEGRAGGTDKVVLGGHSQGFNTGTVGVVALGDLTAARPSSAMVESIARVIAWKFAIHRVDPSTTVPYTTNGSGRYAPGSTISMRRIIGHRDVQTTSCPGATLYAQLGTIRTRVAQLVPSYQAGIASRLVGADLNGDGLQDAVEQQLGSGPDTRWIASGLGTFNRGSTTITTPVRPTAGDFDGNGRDDIFWHGSGSTPDVVWWSGGASQTLDVAGSYTTFTGDFDGDGVDDVLWFAPGPADDGLWYGNRNRAFTRVKISQDLIGGHPVVGDLDGDGRDDILWYGVNGSSDAIWWSTGRGFTSQATTIRGAYVVVSVADGTQGRDELLFVGRPGAASYRWEVGPGRRVTSTRLSAKGVNAEPTVGDFDGDGREDVLLMAYDRKSAIWWATSSGVAVLPMTTAGGYTAVSGVMELLSPRDALLLVSSRAADYLWRSSPSRTFTSSTVG